MPKSISEENDEALQLRLRTVIGTTTNSGNAFSVVPQHQLIAYCAGPAVILSCVDEGLVRRQCIYRTRPGVSPQHITPSFYNPSTPPITPSRSRHPSPLKYGSTRASLLPETPGGSSSISQNKIRQKEAVCLSTSQNGKFLAIGENSQAPQVTIWPISTECPPEIPLSVLGDHSSGIHCVAFSSDTRWLCSLGDVFDGFIFLYAINPKTGAARLHASNKCSSAQTVAWIGDTLVTAGNRHVKVWKTGCRSSTSPSKERHDWEKSASPMSGARPAPFSGRNCLLGPLLLEATFTCIIALSDCLAILCTSSGDVCLLDNSDKLQRISQLQFDISCVHFDPSQNLLWVAGHGNRIVALSLKFQEGADDFISASILCDHAPLKTALLPRQPCIVAIGFLRDCMITVDSDRNLEMRKVEKGNGGSALPKHAHRLSAHESSVLGVVACVESSDFLTYSAQGKVLFWSLDGSCRGMVEISLVQEDGGDPPNELRKLVAPSFDGLLYAGDRLGILQVIHRDGTKVVEIQAHHGEINGIASATLEDRLLVGTCGRDRNVQLFSKGDRCLNHLQTLDDHASAVTDVGFLREASAMLSISSDRSVIIRRAVKNQQDVAFVMVRSVMLKSSPLSFSIVPTSTNLIVVSTMDRQLHTIDISSGRLLPKKNGDAKGESATLNSLEMNFEINQDSSSKRMLLLAVSSTDKSIRIYDYESAALLVKEYCHTSLSAVTIVHREGIGFETSRASLVTCGYDGTVGIWDLVRHRRGPVDLISNGCSSLESPTIRTPVRKILAQTEISGLERLSDIGEATKMPKQRDLSPELIRRKKSFHLQENSNRRYSAALTSPKPIAVATSDRRDSPIGTNTLKAPMSIEPFHHQLSQYHSPVTKKALRSRRQSLNHGRRSKSAANLIEIDDVALQLCKSLHLVRNRIVNEKINPEILSALEHEVFLTAHAITSATPGSALPTCRVIGPSPDELARMIDERLALKAHPLTLAHASETMGSEDANAA